MKVKEIRIRISNKRKRNKKSEIKKKLQKERKFII